MIKEALHLDGSAFFVSVEMMIINTTSNNTFANQMLRYYQALQIPGLPDGVEPLLPFENAETWSVMQTFYQRFYNDTNPRILLMGINPGRLGAGITGIGFTDPVRLADDCGIENSFNRTSEPSSTFIYDVIRAFGGAEKFYQYFHFSSVCPIGFVHNGINFNYYDTPELVKATTPIVTDNLKYQSQMPVQTEMLFSIGKGKNFKFLKTVNTELEVFGKIEALPHPRWVMQYQYKNRVKHLGHYLDLLHSAIKRFEL